MESAGSALRNPVPICVLNTTEVSTKKKAYSDIVVPLGIGLALVAFLLDGLALISVVFSTKQSVASKMYELWSQLPLLAGASFVLSIGILSLPNRLSIVRFFLSVVKTFLTILIIAIMDIGTTPVVGVTIAWLFVVSLRENVFRTIVIEALLLGIVFVFAIEFSTSGVFSFLERPGILVSVFSTLVLFAVPLSIKILMREILRKEIVVIAAHEEMAAITEASAGLLSYSATIEEHSRQMERERIAREIHDSAGYALTTLRMTFEALKGVLQKNDPDQMEQLVEEGIGIAKEALQDMREAMRDLRNEEIHAPQGVPMITRLIRNFQNVTGIVVNSDFLATQSSYGPEIDSTLFRMVQEGLTNAFRHGRATQIHVIITEIQDRLNVTILDNGRADGDVEIGIGLSGMEERIRSVHGTMVFGYLKPGFQVSASIPIGLSDGKPN